MIAFIYVTMMMSGLLINFMSRTVDYDAVAYRTGVILVEDPGEPRYYIGTTNNWHLLDLSIPAERDSLKRLGLSLQRLTPGYLQQQKIDKFFTFASSSACSNVDALCYPRDYQEKLIFGDYPYYFNISLRYLNNPNIRYVGEIPPPKYGYIRRVAKVKQPGASMELNVTNWTSQNVIIRMDFSQLYRISNPLYRIDPLNEKITILLRNFTIPNTMMQNPPFVYVYPSSGGAPTPLMVPVDSPTILVYDSTGSRCASYPCLMSNSSYITVEEGFFKRIRFDEYSLIEINMTFNQPVSDGSPYIFDYSTASLPPPETAVIEVKIW